MLAKTRGIVLSFVKFKETSIIVKIITEKFGLQSYIVNGIRSQKAHAKMAIYQPLTLLDLVVYKNPTKSINRISEVKIEYPLKTIPFDIRKSTIAIFLVEFLSKCIHENETSEEEFEFIYQSILLFDNQKDNYENFHLNFIIDLSAYLGFDIREDRESLQEQLDPHLTQYLSSLYAKQEVKANGKIRNTALDLLLNHYHIHMNWSSNLKSVNVLQQIFS